MAELTGGEILARALVHQRVEHLFYVMGGPMVHAANACEALGIGMVDARHEQASAMMANAYARVRRRVGVCMACSGPGTLNLVTGIAHAHVDGAPVVALGGSSALSERGLGAFQECDQLAAMRPFTRWAERCHEARRIPELVDAAFRHAFGATPGPVYLDLPGDVLYQRVPEEQLEWPEPAARARPLGDPGQVERAIGLLAAAERPIVLTGSGILWSEADADLLALVERFGIPFWTTPQGRGVIPEDHPLCFLAARNTAFREADLVLLVGTRLNYMIGFGRAPRFNAAARWIQVDLDPLEIGRTRPVDAGIVGDARGVLRQLVAASAGRVAPSRYAAWVARLAELNRGKEREAEAAMATGQTPIHPLRLCREVRDFMDRDAVLVVDGNDILNFARQAIPFSVPLSLNSGPFGTMGVGPPFGIGAKVALPGRQVIVLQGDGAFGMNGMELDTAVRHGLNVIWVISNNAGWTAVRKDYRAGQHLGARPYHAMAAGLGCHAELVEDPEQIRPALERAAKSGRPAVLNVIVDPAIGGKTTRFATYAT